MPPLIRASISKSWLRHGPLKMCSNRWTGNMFDLRQYQEAFQLWISALLNPSQFLSEAFAPTNEQFTEGLEFYLKVVVATLFIFGLITTFVENSPLVIRARMLANGLLGIIFLFVGAMAIHFPLWLLGGKSSFYGAVLT
jgi:hypothetical protein